MEPITSPLILISFLSILFHRSFMSSTMNITCTTLTEPARAMLLLKIDGCPPYASTFTSSEQNKYISSRWEVDGYEWEIRFYPRQREEGYYNMALELVFLSEARGKDVTANLSCRLVDPSGIRQASEERISPLKSFQRPSDSSGRFPIMTRTEGHSSGHLTKNGSLTLECTVTVFPDSEAIPVPSPNLQNNLGELLQSEDGADVTFIVSGESISAHRTILAARSPVFKAQFFGEMKEKKSRSIEIKEMEAAVFKAMLGFIYTDTVPELDKKLGTTIAMAQHLLVAAHRYRFERLKVMCERRLAIGMDAGTVATTLALAEQHGCSQLKAKCIDFIAGAAPEILGSVLVTEGFKRLEANCPSVLTELFKAAHGRIKKCGN